MLLAVDIGNTTVKLGLFRGARLARAWRVSSDARRTADECALALSGLLGGARRTIRRSAVASAVPALQETWVAGLALTLRREPLVIDHASPLGLRIAYVPPTDVGVDRLMDAVAAVELAGAPVVVVDFGTAVTLNVVDRRRTYLGGAIAPGLELTAESLARRTAKLPQVALAKPREAIGRSTVESLRSGLVLGAAALVDGLLERMFRELEGRPAVIATGGAAPVVAPHCRHVRRVEPDLTLHGIRHVADRVRGGARRG